MQKLKSLNKLNTFKNEIDKLLFDKGIAFETELKQEEDTNPAFYYYVEENGGFICICKDGEFCGYVLNKGLENRLRQEGYDNNWIEQNGNIWIKSVKIEEFVKNLIPR